MNTKDKTSLALSLGIFTALLLPIQEVIAYGVELKSSGDLRLTGKLEGYEKATLTQIANSIDSFELNKNAGLKLTFSNNGNLRKLEFLAPRPEKAIRTKIEKRLKSINFGSIPGLKEGSTLVLEVELQELMAKSFKRQRFKCTGGVNLVVAGNIAIGGNSISARKTKIDNGEKKAPYTEADKQFAKEIDKLYKEHNSQISLKDFRSKISNRVKASTISEKAEMQVSEKLIFQACVSYILLANEQAKENNLKEARVALEKVMTLSKGLSKKEKTNLALTIVSIANSNHRKNSQKRAKLFLETAQKLVARDRLQNPSLQLAVLESTRKFKTEDVDEQITVSKNILTLLLKQKPVQHRKVSSEYIRLIDSYIAANQKKKARSTASLAQKYFTNSFGVNNIALVKILLKKVELTDSKNSLKKSILEIERLISNYSPSAQYHRFLVYNNSRGRQAQRSLLRFVEKKTQAESIAKNSLERQKVTRIAELAYKLSIKVSGFDRSSFGSLVAVLKSENKLDLLDSLYSSTISYLEKSSNRYNRDYAQSLKSSYARFLRATGNLSKSEKLKSNIKLAINKETEERKLKDSQELAILESSKVKNYRQLVLAKLKMCRWYIKDNDLTSIKKALQEVGVIIESRYNTFGRLSLEQRAITSVIQNVSEIKRADSLYPQIAKLAKLIESKSARGFSNIAFLRIYSSTKNPALKSKLSNLIYKTKKERFKEEKYVEPFWLTSLIRLAEQRKAFDEAAVFQRKYIELIKTINSKSSEMIASEQFKLAKYLVLAGKKEDSVKEYRSGLERLSKTSPGSYLQRYVFATLIPLAEAFTKEKLLDEAGECLQKGFESNKGFSNYKFNTVYQKAVDGLLLEYNSAKKYKEAESFLKILVAQSSPGTIDELEIRLAKFQLETSVQAGVDREKWFKKASQTFEAVVARIQSKQGKDSQLFKTTVRNWVNILESKGYSKEAKIEENRLK